MAAPSFDLLLFGRRKLAGGPSPSQGDLNKIRFRIVQQVFNDRRIVYRNRVEGNRLQLVLSVIENDFARKQGLQRIHRQKVLNGLKQQDSLPNSYVSTRPSSRSADLTERKDFYRFGVRVLSAVPQHRPRPVERGPAANVAHPRVRSASTISRPYTAAGSNFDSEFNEPRNTEQKTRQPYSPSGTGRGKSKVERPSKKMLDEDLERKYEESIRRRQDIERFVTSDLIEEHQSNDPVFAKRYQHLLLAVRSGRIPMYDPEDRDIKLGINRSDMQRARTALITTERSKIKDLYQQQQTINDAQLSERIDVFLKRLAQLKDDEQQQDSQRFN